MTSKLGSGATEERNGDGIVVVGALGLIGEVLSRKLGAGKGPILLVDVDEDRLRSLSDDIRGTSDAEVSYLRLDSSEKNPGLEIVQYLRNLRTPFPHLVNSAYPGKELLQGFADESFSSAGVSGFFSAHVGFFLSVSVHFCRYASSVGGGSLTNFSSIYARISPKFDIYEGTGMTLPVEYGAAKAGIENLSQYLATRFLKERVRVNCVAPGGVLASQPLPFVENYGAETNSGSLLDPGEIAGVVLLLASPAGSSITGQTFTVDGGFGLG